MSRRFRGKGRQNVSPLYLSRHGEEDLRLRLGLVRDRHGHLGRKERPSRGRRHPHETRGRPKRHQCCAQKSHPLLGVYVIEKHSSDDEFGRRAEKCLGHRARDTFAKHGTVFGRRDRSHTETWRDCVRVDE